MKDSQDHSEMMELNAQARAQEQEISHLRSQVAQAHIKEMQLLSEKYVLERKFSDLQMAMDDKKKECIKSSLEELIHRKGVLDENVKLITFLKEAEDERYIFMTTLLGLLAEHGVWPNVANASAISSCVMEKVMEFNPVLGTSADLLYEKVYSDALNVQPHYKPMGEKELCPPTQPMSELPLEFPNHMPEFFPGVSTTQIDDEGPGIEGFQIIGDARPGGKLLGCGFPVRGTSLCIFQFIYTPLSWCCEPRVCGHC